MPKLKTHKATVKRFKFSGAKKRKAIKITRRKSGQDHFNARESGNTMRNKRRDIKADKTNLKTIKKLTPYN